MNMIARLLTSAGVFLHNFVPIQPMWSIGFGLMKISSYLKGESNV